MDKNPEQIIDNNLLQIRNEFSIKNPNIILCSESFLKTEFLIKLIKSIDYEVIFLDFDLLYSGYVISQMIRQNDKVEIYRPNNRDWEKILTKIVKIISKRKFLIIIDSLNGIYNIIDKNESGRFINASLMLLSSIGREAGSLVVITALTRKNNNLEWILSPGGRHIIDSKKSGIYLLNRMDKEFFLNSLKKDGNIEKIFKLTYF